MGQVISKSKFKPQALKFFRQVQETGEPITITDHDKPVLKIVPYNDDPLEALNSLRNSVLEFTDPTEPVGEDEWEASR